jgi:hypothetical protein
MRWNMSCVAGAVIFYLASFNSLFAEMVPERPAGTEATPILGQTSYELRTITSGVGQVEYGSPLGIRINFDNGDVSIWDFSTGENHFLNHITHQDLVHRGLPLFGKPRYYDGRRWLYNMGRCSFIGENGTLWRRPAFGFALEQEACITSDGIILANKTGNRMEMRPISLYRHAIPPLFYKIPRDYHRIITL